jgi:thiamine pyrophosphate-dependent acetolactate synthase large subunit-like protein
MRVGEAVVDALAELDTELVFGIPGVHTIELYRGIARSGLRAVTARHEQGAGFMADGYARATGRPGVCILITGPGVTNALTPMAQAYHDSVPLLVVGSVTRRCDLGRRRGPLHDLPDQAGLVRGVTSFSETVTDAAELGPALRRAWTAMLSGRPRPVHLALPIDLLQAECEPLRWAAPPTTPDAPDRAAVRRAASLLARAATGPAARRRRGGRRPAGRRHRDAAGRPRRAYGQRQGRGALLTPPLSRSRAAVRLRSGAHRHCRRGAARRH